jgi:hypothetical protein
VLDELTFGSVIFCKDFPFLDGGKSDKLLVVLGVIQGSALIVLTTSQPCKPDINAGCDAKRGYFKSQKHARDCFEQDTYVQLWRMGELLPRHVNGEHWKGNAKIVGVLSEHTANAIRKCAEVSEDIIPKHKAMLGKRLPAMIRGPAASVTQGPSKA